MAQKYSGWFLEKLFPAWLFMSFYHGFYSGTGELNSRNHMKYAEWFHPWAKHSFTVGKEMLLRAHMQFRASSPWPVLHLLPSLCREVQPGCWAHLARFLHLEVATSPWREAGVGGKAGLEWVKWFDLLPAVGLSHVWALQMKLVKGSDHSPTGSTTELGFSSLLTVKTEMAKFSGKKKKKGKNVFKKLRSELVGSVLVTSNCLRPTRFLQCPPLFLSIRQSK